MREHGKARFEMQHITGHAAVGGERDYRVEVQTTLSPSRYPAKGKHARPH